MHSALISEPDASTTAVLAVLRQTVARHGKPERIRTDHGAQFTSAEFKRAMKALGIRHELTVVASPWQNPIERMFGTLKGKLDQVQPHDGQALDALLMGWQHWYNFARPHRHLHDYTPAQVWQGIDVWTTQPAHINRFKAWAGLLTGYITQRARRRC